MDLVNNLVLTIGNTFLNLGILVPAEVKADADSVIEVKFCHGLIFSPILLRVQGCIAGNTCRTKRTNHWRNSGKSMQRRWRSLKSSISRS